MTSSTEAITIDLQGQQYTRYCSIQQCFNRRGYPNKHLLPVKFFGLPKDEIRARKWLEACGRLDLLAKYPSKRYLNLCQDHFGDDQFTSFLKLRLTPYAIPTKYLDCVHEESFTETVKEETKVSGTSNSEEIEIPMMEKELDIIGSIEASVTANVPTCKDTQDTTVNVPVRATNARKKFCFVHTCFNQKGWNENLKRNITFFTLPRDETRRMKWLEICGRYDLLETKCLPNAHSYHICQDHFQDNQFTNSQKEKLKENAMPSKFKVLSSHLAAKQNNQYPSNTNLTNTEERNPNQLSSLNSESCKQIPLSKSAFFCAVPNCQNKRGWNQNTNSRLLFSFPKQDLRRTTWLLNCGLTKKTSTDLALYICSQHFNDSQFTNPEKKDRLILTAIPSIFPSNSNKNLQSSDSSVKEVVVNEHSEASKENSNGSGILKEAEEKENRNTDMDNTSMTVPVETYSEKPREISEVCGETTKARSLPLKIQGSQYSNLLKSVMRNPLPKSIERIVIVKKLNEAQKNISKQGTIPKVSFDKNYTGGGKMCSYKNCKNDKFANPTLFFYRYPAVGVKDIERCNIWLEKSGRPDFIGMKSRNLYDKFLCSEHFHESQFMNGTAVKKRLIWNAIPMSPEEPNDKDYVSQYAKRCIMQALEEDNLIKEHNEKNITRAADCDGTISISNGTFPPIALSDVPTARLNRELNDRLSGPPSKKATLGARPRHLTLTPKDVLIKRLSVAYVQAKRRNALQVNSHHKEVELKTRLNKALSDLVEKKKSFTASKAKVRILNKRVVQLQARMEKLKGKYVSKSMKDKVLRSVPVNTRGLLDIPLKFSLVRKEWTWFLKYRKHFANLLYFNDPRSYDLCREMFSLPHSNTLKRYMTITKWYLWPGFSNKVFNILREKTKSASEIQKICAVSFEVIPLKSFVELNSKENVIEGLVDLGLSERQNCVADRVMIFKAEGLCEDWKQPLGYVFIQGKLTDEQHLVLIFNSVIKIRDAGYKVKIISCDPTPENRLLFTLLGVSAETPYILIEDIPVVIMYYIPDVMTDIHAVLFKKNLNIGSDQVSWQDIASLYRIDILLPNRFLGKLTAKHITHSKQTPPYVYDVFSQEVGTTLKSFSGMHLPDIKSSALATADFVLNMATIINCFGVTNERTISNASDLFKQVNFLKSKLSWIKTWHFEDMSAELECVDCLLQSISALIHFLGEIETEESITNFKMFYITQQRFKVIGNHPLMVEKQISDLTPSEFRTVFQLSVTNSLFQPLSKSLECFRERNLLTKCVERTNINIQKVVDRMEDGSLINVFDDLIPEDGPIYITTEQGPYVISEFIPVDNALYYITAWLIRKILNEHICEKCTQLICHKDLYLSENSEFATAFRCYSNEPYDLLPAPTDDFFQYVCWLEKTFIENVYQFIVRYDVPECIILSLKAAEYVWTSMNGCEELIKLTCEYYSSLRLFFYLFSVNGGMLCENVDNKNSQKERKKKRYNTYKKKGNVKILKQNVSEDKN